MHVLRISFDVSSHTDVSVSVSISNALHIPVNIIVARGAAPILLHDWFAYGFFLVRNSQTEHLRNTSRFTNFHNLIRNKMRTKSIVKKNTVKGINNTKQALVRRFVDVHWSVF